MVRLFNEPKNIFKWADIKTFLLRNQYNEALSLVVNDYFTKQYVDSPPNFLNTNYCLTLKSFEDHCKCNVNSRPYLSTSSKWDDVIKGQKDYNNTLRKWEEDRKILTTSWRIFEGKKEKYTIDKPSAGDAIFQKFDELKQAIIDGTNASVKAKDLSKALIPPVIGTNYDDKLISEFALLQNHIIQFESSTGKYTKAQNGLTVAKNEFEKEKTKLEFAIETSRIALDSSINDYRANPDAITLREKENAENQYNENNNALIQLVNGTPASSAECQDWENYQFCLPPFQYIRLLSLPMPIKDKNGNEVDINFDFNTNGLTVGSVFWLYFYERMGIFKILGALMDDYNYRGKYTISGNRKDSNGNANSYSILMDMVCTWHRLGMSSNLRDRICLYQRVLGVSIDNNLGITSERNTGFMGTFNKLIDYMLEYYKDKRLAVAINNNTTGRSSVATQTSIKDTVNLLRQQFEPFQYGRNQINTLLGIATVHATIDLLYNIRKEIGIPDQYGSPEEFIPAAYDILVTKRSVTLNETNRYIIHDNCASYGYRLLTDLETVDMNQMTTGGTGGVIDLWLDDVEGWVEGYRNAYSAVPEKAEAIV